MAVDEQDNPSESTPREAELQRQLDGLQSQVTYLHKEREATENPELSSEVQSMKENLDEHSKQLEQSAEKLTQLESENLEDAESRARTQQKQATRKDRSDRDDISSQKSMKDQGSKNRGRYWDQRQERPRYKASYLENRIPATITPRKSSGSRIRDKLIRSSRFGPEKCHSPARKGRWSACVISICCQIPRHPKNSGQIRSTKKQDEIPHFPRKGPLGRPIFCVHSEGIRPQKTLEVLNQPGGDDHRPSPRNPKSPTTPWPFKRRGTHLEAGSSMTPGQKISKPQKTMKGGTLSTLSTTPRLIIRENVEGRPEPSPPDGARLGAMMSKLRRGSPNKGTRFYNRTESTSYQKANMTGNDTVDVPRLSI
uniref:Uncharacterized protein n=1 Tax=Brassica campestris TaxID=3711 RepID=M4FA26_BRACM